MARLRRGQERRSLSPSEEGDAEDKAPSAVVTGAGLDTSRDFSTAEWSELFPGWLINAALGWAAAKVAFV